MAGGPTQAAVAPAAIAASVDSSAAAEAHTLIAATPVEAATAAHPTATAPCISSVPDHDGGRPMEVNACILITHMVYL